MERRSKGKKRYMHDGVPVEVFAKRSDSYQDLLKRGCEALDMQAPAGKRVSLFRPSGIQILPLEIDGQPWTLGTYLRCTKKSAEKSQFGLGFVDGTMVSNLQLPRVHETDKRVCKH